MFKWHGIRPCRDITLFVIGIAGIIHETAFTGVDRPGLLVLFGAMVGLPAFLRTDERSKTKRNGNGANGR